MRKKFALTKKKIKENNVDQMRSVQVRDIRYQEYA